MVADGWVAVDGEEVVSGRLRRYFVLTEATSNRSCTGGCGTGAQVGGYDELWTPVALALPLLALAVDRGRRRRTPSPAA